MIDGKVEKDNTVSSTTDIWVAPHPPILQVL